MKSEKRQKTPRPIKEFSLLDIQPLTKTQGLIFNEYDEGKHLILHGYPGTGKSFLSIYLSLDEILNVAYTKYKKLVIIRSVVQGRSLGFLPGTPKEKAAIFEVPYKEIINNLFHRDDAYEICKNKDIVEFESTSFLRGITFHNCIVFVDEIQNMTFQELSTIITRCGDNCKFIFSGDFFQTDLTKSEEIGIFKFMDIAKNIDEFSFIEMQIDDIVRSEIVKKFIIEKIKYEKFSSYSKQHRSSQIGTGDD